MEQQIYIIAIDGDEQYRTTNRGQAKAWYNLVDENFEPSEVDGRKKQLLEFAKDGWNSKILFEDIINCPKAEQDEEKEEELSLRRGWHR